MALVLYVYVRGSPVIAIDLPRISSENIVLGILNQNTPGVGNTYTIYSRLCVTGHIMLQIITRKLHLQIMS